MTAIVSMAIILDVAAIVAPFLTKAEMRKYKATLYFLKVPKDVIPQMITNCKYVLKMNNKKRYAEI